MKFKWPAQVYDTHVQGIGLDREQVFVRKKNFLPSYMFWDTIEYMYYDITGPILGNL